MVLQFFFWDETELILFDEKIPFVNTTIQEANAASRYPVGLIEDSPKTPRTSYQCDTEELKGDPQ